MSNYELKILQDKLNELPEDTRNMVIDYGNNLYEEYKKEQFEKDNQPQQSILELYKFSSNGSLHVVLTDIQDEFTKIAEEVSNNFSDEWIYPIDQCYLDGTETPQQQIQRIEKYYHLASEGANIVFRTNSYFVIKKLYLLAMNNWKSYDDTIGTQIFLLQKIEDDTWQIQSFNDGMPDNFITDASIDMYHEKISL